MELGNYDDSTSSQPACLQQALAASEWERLVQIIKTGVSVTDLQVTIKQACAENQWDFIRRISESRKNLQERDVIFGALLNSTDPGELNWDCILQIVKDGVSWKMRSKLVLQAARDGEWPSVCELTSDGVEGAVRDQVFAQAVEQGQWKCAAWMTKLGVDLKVKERVLKTVIQLGQFDIELVKACTDPSLTSIVLREAAKEDMWQLVSELVKLNCTWEGLEEASVRAVTRGQWDCAFCILNHGVYVSQFIVEEAFKAGVALQLVDLLEKTLQTNLRSTIVRLAVQHRQCEVYFTVANKYQITDSEQKMAFKAALVNKNKKFFRGLVRRTKSGRRVLKQLALKKIWSKQEGRWMCEVLKKVKEADLVILLSATFNFFSYFHTMLKKSRNSRKLSPYVMRYLMSHDDVEVRETFLCKKKDRHAAFLWALRRGNFSGAQSLTDIGKHVSYSDLKFAFRMCHSLQESPKNLDSYLSGGSREKQMKMARFGLQLYLKDALEDFSDHTLSKFFSAYRQLENLDITRSNGDSRPPLLNCFKFSIDLCLKSKAVGAAECFAKICLEQPRSQADLDYAVMAALPAKEKSFIHQVWSIFGPQGGACENGSLLCALNTAVHQNMWPAVKELLEGYLEDSECGEEELSLCSDVLVHLLMKSVFAQQMWTALMPFLEKWITVTSCRGLENFSDGLDKFWITQEEKELAPLLVKWCHQNSYDNTALLFAAMQRDFDVIITVLQQTADPRALDSQLLTGICNFALSGRLCDPDLWDKATGIAWILELPMKPEWDSVFRLFYALEQLSCNVSFLSLDEATDQIANLGRIIACCGKAGLQRWEMYFRCQRGDWLFIDRYLENCTDKTVIDIAVRIATHQRHWKLAEKYLDRCTQWSRATPEPIANLFMSSVTHGQTSVVEKLLPRIDASRERYAEWDSRDRYIVVSCLQLVIMNNDGVTCDNMVQLMIKAGVSTFQPQCNREIADLSISPLYYAVERGKMTVAKLLLASGAVSNADLHRIKTDSGLRSTLAFSERSDDVKLLDEVGRNPDKLEHLARCCVSHCIGTGPKREERIKSLSVSDIIKDMIRFEDLFEETPEASKLQ